MSLNLKLITIMFLTLFLVSSCTTILKSTCKTQRINDVEANYGELAKKLLENNDCVILEIKNSEQGLVIDPLYNLDVDEQLQISVYPNEDEEITNVVFQKIINNTKNNISE